MGVTILGIDLKLSNISVYNFVDIDSFAFVAKEDDFQIGFVFNDSREIFQRFGLLRFKIFDAMLKTGVTFGRSFTTILKLDFNLYGLTPGNYSFHFLVSPMRSSAVFRINQKLFLANNALNLFWYEEFGNSPFGFARIAIRQKDFSYGLYRVENGIFPGVFLYPGGRLSEEGLFAGIGWFNGLAQFFSLRKNLGLKQSSMILEPMLIVKQNELIPAMKLESIGGKLSLDFFLMPGKVLLRVCF